MQLILSWLPWFRLEAQAMKGKYVCQVGDATFTHSRERKQLGYAHVAQFADIKYSGADERIERLATSLP